MKTSIRLLCLILFALAIALPAPSQPIPEVGHPVHFDISPPMRDVNLPPQAPDPSLSRPLMAVPRAPQAPQFDPALQSTPGGMTNTTPGVNFDGVAVGLPGCNCAPPDTNMAVGPNHVVQWANTLFAVYDKAGKIFPGYPKAGNSFWSKFGGACENTNSGDPIAQYDRAADRWVMSQLAISNSGYFQCFAVSTTGDPGGTYAQYSYAFGTDLNDYPKIGVWPVSFTGAPQGAYFASYNIFAFGASFSGSRPCAYDRAAMLAGNSSATQVCFQQSNQVGSLLPTDLDGSTAPPSGEPNFYFDYGTKELLMWKFTPNFSTPANSSFTGPQHISVDAFTPLGGGVPQLGTSQTLDTLSDRLMYRVAYRNLGDHEAVFVSHSVTGGYRWYEIRTPNATPTKFQDGTFGPDGSNRWMGSIASDQNGNIAIGYSVSSSSMHPAIRFTGREPGDPLGMMQTETSLFEGPGSQTAGLSRWGDYSALRIDPADDCTFWYTTEYIPSNGTFNWHTRIASFKFNSCLPPPPPLPPGSLTAMAVSSHEIDLSWMDNSDNESGFKIERCTGSSCTSFSEIAQVAANVTAYADTTVAAAATYTYRVRAFNAGGNSPYSNNAEAMTPAETAPSNLTATPTSKKPVDSFVDLQWQDNSNNETNFVIERCVGAGCIDFSPLNTVGANMTTYHDAPTLRRTTYVYRVKARTAAGDTAYSNTASATTK